MSLNPPTQYASDAKLRVRQRLWGYQHPPFDLVSWVLALAELSPGSTERILDVGCGNGVYLARLRSCRNTATGCDLSQGMLGAARATKANLVNADVTGLPFAASTFDVVLAPHMLYHGAPTRTLTLTPTAVVDPISDQPILAAGGAQQMPVRSSSRFVTALPMFDVAISAL